LLALSTIAIDGKLARPFVGLFKRPRRPTFISKGTSQIAHGPTTGGPGTPPSQTISSSSSSSTCRRRLGVFDKVGQQIGMIRKGGVIGSIRKIVGHGHTGKNGCARNSVLASGFMDEDARMHAL